MGKKYHNPIPKPEMVRIPVWEYSALVAKATALGIVQTLIENDRKYMAADLMEVLLRGKEEEA